MPPPSPCWSIYSTAHLLFPFWRWPQLSLHGLFPTLECIYPKTVSFFQELSISLIHHAKDSHPSHSLVGASNRGSKGLAFYSARINRTVQKGGGWRALWQLGAADFLKGHFSSLLIFFAFQCRYHETGTFFEAAYQGSFNSNYWHRSPRSFLTHLLVDTFRWMLSPLLLLLLQPVPVTRWTQCSALFCSDTVDIHLLHSVCLLERRIFNSRGLFFVPSTCKFHWESPRVLLCFLLSFILLNLTVLRFAASYSPSVLRITLACRASPSYTFFPLCSHLEGGMMPAVWYVICLISPAKNEEMFSTLSIHSRVLKQHEAAWRAYPCWLLWFICAVTQPSGRILTATASLSEKHSSSHSQIPIPLCPHASLESHFCAFKGELLSVFLYSSRELAPFQLQWDPGLPAAAAPPWPAADSLIWAHS